MPNISELTSPMMVQYRALKNQHPDALLFYRMGDFYEMFFDDAVAASEALDIALTRRGKIKGQDIPMCGVPAHSAEGYLQTLIKKAFRVAVCEQVEDPAEVKKRGYKALVRREVVRLLTPGTLTEDSLLEARLHNFLASVAVVRGEMAIAWTDISSGLLSTMRCPPVKLGPQLARIAPREILVSENLDPAFDGVLEETDAAVTSLSSSNFDSTKAERRLAELYGVSTLDAFGEFRREELAALGALISYLELTQKGKLPLLLPPTRELLDGTMQIDPATRRNLELTRDFSGGKESSLLAAIDRTVTSGGARLLERRISAPSTDIETIRERHDEIGNFLDRPDLRKDVRSELRRLPDMDRALSRICLGRGGPRDLAAIRDGLQTSEAVHTLMTTAGVPSSIDLLSGSSADLKSVAQTLAAAIVAQPGVLARDGGFVQSGYDPLLDEELRLRDQARSVIAELQAEYVQLSGIASLKVKHNNVLGYFVETPSSHFGKLTSAPLSATFIHRQTTASAVRFTTTRLAETETRILDAASKSLQIEMRIFDGLCELVAEFSAPVSNLARQLAEIDVASALAELSATDNWCRPEVNMGSALEITGGRHPVVEQALRSSGGTPFIPNDCHLSADDDGPRIRLLTGPNMAGKSTYLRQNALIALLAQAGSFIPADSARVGIVSQLFSRVGAADDLARGRSTFMVEMVETAAILHQAESRALVILDEIGRGTATYDGLAIAWATLEHLHEITKCRTLFATHYHELTQLDGRLDRLANATVAVREWEGEVIFLHEVRDGSADRSYGVQVAKLAGIPPSVIDRANEILERLESDDPGSGTNASSILEDLPLFAAAAASAKARVPVGNSEIEARLASVNPDELNPRDALSLVYDLKELMREILKRR